MFSVVECSVAITDIQQTSEELKIECTSLFFSLQFRREATVCATAPWSQKNRCGSSSKPGQGLTMLL